MDEKGSPIEALQPLEEENKGEVPPLAPSPPEYDGIKVDPSAPSKDMKEPVYVDEKTPDPPTAPVRSGDDVGVGEKAEEVQPPKEFKDDDLYPDTSYVSPNLKMKGWNASYGTEFGRPMIQEYVDVPVFNVGRKFRDRIGASKLKAEYRGMSRTSKKLGAGEVGY